MTKVRSVWFIIKKSIVLFWKAVVRAMDTAQEFLRQQGIQVPQNFVIGGLSKVDQFH